MTTKATLVRAKHTLGGMEESGPSAWAQVTSHLFFLFFTSPILSPALNDKSIYLNWLVPLLDPRFMRYLLLQLPRLGGNFIASSSIFMLWLLITAPETALRWLLILWPLAYLVYAFETKVFFLYFWMQFNVGIAVVQAIVYYAAGPGAAMLIGPSNIAATIWGPYSTKTFTNFYSIVPGVEFPRFSGLSREGGFFASLLATTVLLRRSAAERVGIALILGVLLSLSKATAFLAFGLLVVHAAKRDRKSPAILFMPIFLALVTLYYIFADDVFMAGNFSTTFTHRIYPYAALFHGLDFINLLVGNWASPTVLAQFKAFQVCANLTSFAMCLDMPSFASLIFSAGIVGLCLYIWQLSAMGCTLWGVLAILILTANVAPLSNTSFVVLSYFLALKLGRWHGQPGQMTDTKAANPAAQNTVNVVGT